MVRHNLQAIVYGDTESVIALALEDEDLAERGLVSEPTILVTLELEPLRRAG